MKNKILVQCLDQNCHKLASRIKKNSEKLLDFLSLQNVILDIFLTDSRLMRALNKKYRQRDKVTNVLSFSTPKGFVFPQKLSRHLGEIYLCPGYIRAHKEDVNHMLIHGLLHLLGYDHEKKSDRIKMEAREKQLLKKLK